MYSMFLNLTETHLCQFFTCRNVNFVFCNSQSKPIGPGAHRWLNSAANQEFSTLCRHQRFIATFTSIWYWSLSWARWNQSIHPSSIPLLFISTLLYCVIEIIIYVHVGWNTDSQNVYCYNKNSLSLTRIPPTHSCIHIPFKKQKL
jgi:hypothetical protein